MARRRTAVPAASVFGSNPIYYASYMFGQGYSEDTILTGLEERFPGLPAAYLENAMLLGEQAAGVGAGFGKLGQNRRFPPGNMPIDPNLPSNYRYVVVAFCADSSGENSIYRTFVIDSNDNLTKGELRDATNRAFSAALGTNKYFAEQLLCDPAFMGIKGVEGVFRRS